MSILSILLVFLPFIIIWPASVGLLKGWEFASYEGHRVTLLPTWFFFRRATLHYLRWWIVLWIILGLTIDLFLWFTVYHEVYADYEVSSSVKFLTSSLESGRICLLDIRHWIPSVPAYPLLGAIIFFNLSDTRPGVSLSDSVSPSSLIIFNYCFAPLSILRSLSILGLILLCFSISRVRSKNEFRDEFSKVS
jgi:hypothetical protein